ncbi:MAG: hypothetical protein KIS77_11465 [Saprospiraceae bacterium]|nr:hypothetical protein [Saprospiraceae bacterium]
MGIRQGEFVAENFGLAEKPVGWGTCALFFRWVKVESDGIFLANENHTNQSRASLPCQRAGSNPL